MLAICGGLMRTGSVAMFQIMRELVESQKVGYAPVFPLNKEIEYWESHVQFWAETTDIVVAKLHRWDYFLDSYSSFVRVVMTIRDMRDVVVSLMNFRGGTFESSLNSDAFKGNLREQARWILNAGDNKVMQVRYEDFVRNRVEMTQAVADFLGIPVSRRRAWKIEQKWNISANLLRAKANHSPDDPEFMSKRHIQSGRVSQWPKVLTAEQITMVQDRVGHEWFRANGYKVWDG